MRNQHGLAVTALIVIGLAMPCLAVAESAGVTRLSEPVERTESYEVFGAPLPEGGDPLSLGELIAESETYQDSEVLLSTRIAKVCQKKGCFFVAQEGAATARISFKDYGFFIPTDSGGRHVTLHGVFSREAVSQGEADHYAGDLGETGGADPGRFSYSIVASAVKIYH